MRLVSADALGVGTRDESLRESAWDATVKEEKRPRTLFFKTIYSNLIAANRPGFLYFQLLIFAR